MGFVLVYIFLWFYFALRLSDKTSARSADCSKKKQQKKIVNSVTFRCFLFCCLFSCYRVFLYRVYRSAPPRREPPPFLLADSDGPIAEREMDLRKRRRFGAICCRFFQMDYRVLPSFLVWPGFHGEWPRASFFFKVRHVRDAIDVGSLVSIDLP